MGAPTKYKAEYCNKVVSLMSEGKSKETVAVELGVSKQTLYTWAKTHPELLDAIKRGEQASLVWWQEKGRENLENRSFNAVLWYMNMKNRFGWSDKVTNTGEDAPTTTLKVEVHNMSISEILEELKKRNKPKNNK